MNRLKLVLIPILMAVLLSGCAGQSLSNLTIVQGVGIDLENNETVVTMQYLNLAKSTGATDSLSENITTTVMGKSVNISDALFSASKSLSQSIFFGQNKLIVFGSDYAGKDISIGLDYLIRSVDSRPDVIVAMSDDMASDVVSSKERDARIPAESLYNLITTGEKNGLGAVVTVNDLLRLYSSETSDIYMPVLHADEDNCSCVGIAIFSDEKYATTLDESATLGFLLIEDKIDDASIVVHSENLGNIGIEIMSQKAKNTAFVKNDTVYFKTDIDVEITLDDVQKGVTATVSDDTVKSIEHLVSQEIEKDCYLALNTCAQSNSDPIEIGKYLAMYDEDAYSSIKSDWKNRLPLIKFDVNVDVHMTKVNESVIR